MSEERLPDSIEEHGGQVQPAEEQKRTPQEEAEQALVQEVLDNYAFVTSVEDAQRALEDDDLEFEDGEQWTEEALAAREEHNDDVSGRKFPGRPAITINLCEQRVQQIVNEAREARLTTSVGPKSGWATPRQAGYMKGVIRSIHSDSGSHEVRLWALERAAICGRGAYLIDVDYANDGDFDLDIIIKRFLDQSTVYFDPYHTYADARDAGWVIITDVLSEEDRRRRYPLKPIIVPEGAFEDAKNHWFTISDDKRQQVRIARYLKIVASGQALGYHPMVGKMPLDQMPEKYAAEVKVGAEGTRMRPIGQKVLDVTVDGSQVLERGWWLGRYLPVIPVIGKEKVVKGKRSWKGVVRNLKDMNRGYNVSISSAVESAGSMPRAPYIMYEGQDESYEEMWDDSPVKNYTRLYVRDVTLRDGTSAPLPARQSLEPEIQGALLLARSFKDDIASQSGIIDAARAINPYARSGKFVEALQKQGAAGSSNYLDNLAQVSMMQEGRVLIDLIPKVHDRRGRIVSVVGEEYDDETAVMLKRPFITDEDGTPVAVPCPICKGKKVVPGERTWRNLMPDDRECQACEGDGYATRETMPKEWQGQRVEYVDLAEGQFKLTVTVGRNFQNKQEEAMSAMTQLATAAPPLVPVYADLWVRAMAFSGANEIADRLKRNNPYAGDDKKKADIPPELMQRFQALYAEHQQAMQQLQQATEMLRTDAVKMSGQKDIKAMEAEAKKGVEHLKLQGEVLREAAEGRRVKELEVLRGDLEAMRQESEHRHEILLQLLKERGAKEIERHKSDIHQEAEAKAAAEL